MILKNLKKTKKFLKEFSIVLKKKLKIKKNLIVIFSGQLGTGKTTFIKEIAKNLGVKEILKSPSFVLWQIYSFKLNKKIFFLNHIDLYRVSARSILKISLKKQIKRKFNIFLIEWGEKLEKYFIKNNIKFIKVSIKKIGKYREVEIENK